MPIYTLRYKSTRFAGVQLAQFDGENDARGLAAAQAWCNREPGRQFIGLAPFLTATAVELLGPMPNDAPIEQAPIEQDAARRGPGRPAKPVGAPAV
jgi:hypothetical protein